MQQVSVIIEKMRKIFIIAMMIVVGGVYFMVGIFSGIVTMCDCLFGKIGWYVGALLLFASFIMFPVFAYSREPITGIKKIFIPYIALPLFIILLLSGGFVDSLLEKHKFKLNAESLPVVAETIFDEQKIQWTTYHNTEYGYSIDYPINLVHSRLGKVYVQPNYIEYNDNTEFVLTYTNVQEPLMIVDVLDKNSLKFVPSEHGKVIVNRIGKDSFKGDEIIINNTEGVLVDTEEKMVVFFQNNTNIIKLDCSPSRIALSEFERKLCMSVYETFRFEK